MVPSKNPLPSPKKPVPTKIQKQLNKWSWQSYVLRYVHASLGIMSIAFSLLVAAKISSFEQGLTEWLAFFAAVSVGLMSGFDLGSKSNRMRRAWRLLNAAIIKYEESNATLESVIKVYEEAETIIGDVKEEPRA